MRIDRWVYTLPLRLRSLFRRPSVEQDLDDEIRDHLDRQTNENIAAGMSPSDARTAALRSFGGIERRKEEVRDTRGVTLIENVLRDIRFAARGLRKSPAFTGAAVLTLALGIGLATAVFTVADAILLRQLPVHDQDRVVVLWGETRDQRTLHYPLRLEDARDFARRSQSLTDVAFVSYYGAIDKPIRDGDRVSRLRRSQVSGNFFDVLGAKPTLGRALRASDDVIGAAPVIVLSHAVWLRRFGGGDVLGRRIQTYDDGMTYTVVGVMPHGFDYPSGTDFWAPVVASTPAADASEILLNVVARLSPRAAAANARDDLTAYFGRPEAGRWQRNLHGVVHTLPQLVVGDMKPALFVFAVAAGLLLLITCSNVANLLLVRGVARRREIALRSALGGSRTRIVAQLVTESAILAIVGGTLGMALATFAVQGFVALAPAGAPRLDEIHVNGAALAAAVAITALAILVFGLVPALMTSRVDLPPVLGSGTRLSASRPSRLLTETLVVGQIALALLVLSSAGLLARSLIKLQGAQLSFDPSHLLIGELSVPLATFGGEAKQRALLDRLLPRLAAIPGVRSLSPVVAVPFSGSHGWDGTFAAEGQAAAEIAVNPTLNMEVITPAYFPTFSIPILRGRAFTDADRQGAPDVVVVSQSTAHHFWPGADAIGKRFVLGGKATDTLTVVGVVADTRYRDLRELRPTVYYPLNQSFFGYVPMTLAIRTTGMPAEVVPAIRRVISETEPSVVLASAAPFDDFLAGPLAQPRLNAFLLAIFAGAAVALAAIGLFGVMMTMVRQQTRELGVRMALGANAGDVRRMVMRRGLRIAAPGIALGLVGALLANRLLAAMLYEVSPTDGATLGGVSGLLLGVAALASFIPAQSSARIDPVEALRAD